MWPFSRNVRELAKLSSTTASLLKRLSKVQSDSFTHLSSRIRELERRQLHESPRSARCAEVLLEVHDLPPDGKLDAGYLFATAWSSERGVVHFVSLEDAPIVDGIARVRAGCTIPGSAGNVCAGSVVYSIGAAFLKVTNPHPAANGMD